MKSANASRMGGLRDSIWKVGEQEQERKKTGVWDCNEEREKTDREELKGRDYS